jgi:DNA polymerase-1
MPFAAACANCPLADPTDRVSGEWWSDGDWTGPTVMGIGINPGRVEVAEGHPFIGPSGAALKHALRAAGIRRAWLTNAYRCPGEPDALYARACHDELEAEIAQVRPQWVFALGNIALQRLLGRGRVGVMSGKETWSAKYETWVLPVPHPAAMLRNRGSEPAWLADIMRFGRLIRGELAPPPATPPVVAELVDTSDKLLRLQKLLAHEPVVAYDFEANTAPWWSKDFSAHSVAFSFTGNEGLVVPLAHPDTDPAWRRMIGTWLGEQHSAMTARHTLVHNGVYDDLVWYRLTGWLPRPWWDTMVGLQLLDENAPKGLKWAGRAYLGWPDWDIDARKQHPLQELFPYNAYDAAALPQLWARQQELLGEDPWLSRYAETVEMPKLRALERMLVRGIYVDRSAAARLLEQAWRERQAADRSVPVANPASHPQVARWLYQILGLPVLVNGKNHPSTSESVVNRLAQTHPEARLILACRRPRKKISTYFRPIGRATKTSFDGRFHPEMRTTSVETGRLSGFFHTIPRDTSVRPIFSAPPGRVLLSADYRQVEARLCAWMAVGEPDSWGGVPHNSMLWAFHERQDIYRLFASLALHKHPKQITKEDRQVFGKVPVLAQLYDISWQGLKEYAWRAGEIDWPDHTARRLYDLFRRIFPEFPVWHRFEAMKLRSRGEARSPIGRVRRLPDAVYGSQEAIRSGINARPQSLASDLTQASMILLDRVGAHIVGNIHDALLIEAPENLAAGQAEVIARVMTRDALDYLQPLGLRLPDGLIEVELSQGPWGLGEPVAA